LGKLSTHLTQAGWGEGEGAEREKEGKSSEKELPVHLGINTLLPYQGH